MSCAVSTIDSPGLEVIVPVVLLMIAVLPFLGQATRQQVTELGYVKYTLHSRNDTSRAALLTSTPAQVRIGLISAPGNAYASSQTCRTCDPSEYNSYHRTMILKE